MWRKCDCVSYQKFVVKRRHDNNVASFVDHQSKVKKLIFFVSVVKVKYSQPIIIVDFFPLNVFIRDFVYLQRRIVYFHVYIRGSKKVDQLYHQKMKKCQGQYLVNFFVQIFFKRIVNKIQVCFLYCNSCKSFKKLKIFFIIKNGAQKFVVLIQYWTFSSSFLRP